MGIAVMNPKPTIRRATAADADEIVACVDAAYRPYLARMGKPPGPMLDDYREIVRRYPVFVAAGESEVAGVLVLMPGARSILLDNVAVHPKWQGRGFGGRLMEFAEAEARRLGFTGLDLYTHECMVENIARYARRGYRETGRVTEKGYARVYMRKALDS